MGIKGAHAGDVSVWSRLQVSSGSVYNILLTIPFRNVNKISINRQAKKEMEILHQPENYNLGESLSRVFYPLGVKAVI